MISVLGLDESKHTFLLPVQSRAKVSFVTWSSDDVVTIVVRMLRWSVHDVSKTKGATTKPKAQTRQLARLSTWTALWNLEGFGHILVGIIRCWQGGRGASGG